METIQQAKEHLRKNFDKGTNCPCCGQFVKLYKRKLNSSQVRGLINLYHLDKKDKDAFFHIRKITKDVNLTGDFAKMVYWKLVEEQTNEDSKKRTSGNWRITELGRKFLRNEINVPSHILLYNSKFQGYKPELTNVTEALGKKFDYQELMNN